MESLGHEREGDDRLVAIRRYPLSEQGSTLVATCEANGVNPLDYLSDVLLRVQDHPAAEIDDLLPHRWKPRSA